jgi:hypothetical protein
MAGLISLLLCEYATIGADKTCTIVRGGIETWTSPLLPLELNNWLFVQIDANALAPGEYDGAVSLLSPNGLSLNEIQMRLTVVASEFPGRFVAPIRGSVQTYGTCTIRVRIGPLEAELALVVKENIS